MIDPFGVSETPMRTIGRILKNPKSEVYISLMYREMNRFLAHPSFESHLDTLFGCSDWRDAVQLSDSEARKAFLFELYENQLKESGARYVVHFELYEKQQLIYAIFFGTHDLEGCDKMKQAIWKVVPFGDFKFRGSQLGQLTLGPSVWDFSLLERALLEQFQPKGWQEIQAVEAFVKSDSTQFHSGQLKVRTLKPMESNGKIEVRPGTRRRSGTYPRGTVLRFL